MLSITLLTFNMFKADLLPLPQTFLIVLLFFVRGKFIFTIAYTKSWEVILNFSLSFSLCLSLSWPIRMVVQIVHFLRWGVAIYIVGITDLCTKCNNFPAGVNSNKHIITVFWEMKGKCDDYRLQRSFSPPTLNYYHGLRLPFSAQHLARPFKSGQGLWSEPFTGLSLKVFTMNHWDSSGHCSDFVLLLSPSFPLPLLLPYSADTSLLSFSLLTPFLLSGLYSNVPLSIRASLDTLFKIASLSHSLSSSQLYFQSQHLSPWKFLIYFISFDTFYFGKCKLHVSRDLCFIQCGFQPPRTVLGIEKTMKMNTF